MRRNLNNRYCQIWWQSFRILAVFGISMLCLIQVALATTISTPSTYSNYFLGYSAAIMQDYSSASVFFRKIPLTELDDPGMARKAMVAMLQDGHIQDVLLLAQRFVGSNNNHNDGTIVTSEMTASENNDYFFINKLSNFIIGIAAIKQKQYKNAVVAFKAAEGLSGAEGTIKIFQALAIQNHDGAQASAKAIRDARLPVAIQEFFIGTIMAIDGKLEEAVSHFESATKHDPKSYRFAESYIRALANTDKERAINACDLYKGIEAFVAIKSAILADQKVSLFINNLQEGFAFLLYEFAISMKQEGVPPLVGGFLQLSSYLNPSNHLPLLEIAGLYDDLGYASKAIAILDKVHSESSFYKQAQLKVARYYIEMQNYHLAEKIIDEVFSQNPNDISVILELGNLFQSRKHYDKAINLYTSAIKNRIDANEDPDWYLFFYRGVNYERLERWEEAEKDLAKALELDKENPNILNYLGYLWVDRKMNLSRGLKMLEMAVARASSEADIIDSLGWAYYRLKRFAEATLVLEHAVLMKPWSPEINDHLGDLYWHTNRKREAVFQWQHALKLVKFDQDIDKHISERLYRSLQQKLREGLEDNI